MSLPDKPKSPLPKGAMAALLAGWHNHDPVIYLEDPEPWISLWPPHEGPNKDWREGCHKINFKIEPEILPYIKWFIEKGRREIRYQIRGALGL